MCRTCRSCSNLETVPFPIPSHAAISSVAAFTSLFPSALFPFTRLPAGNPAKRWQKESALLSLLERKRRKNV